MEYELTTCRTHGKARGLIFPGKSALYTNIIYSKKVNSICNIHPTEPYTWNWVVDFYGYQDDNHDLRERRITAIYVPCSVEISLCFNLTWIANYKAGGEIPLEQLLAERKHVENDVVEKWDEDTGFRVTIASFASSYRRIELVSPYLSLQKSLYIFSKERISLFFEYIMADTFSERLPSDIEFCVVPKYATKIFEKFRLNIPYMHFCKYTDSGQFTMEFIDQYRDVMKRLELTKNVCEEENN